MSYYPDHITWMSDNATADEELQAAMEPFEECEHEYVGGRCLDCDDIDEDFDPTPYGALIDSVDALSYRGLVKL
jgi:hypothetical protein